MREHRNLWVFLAVYALVALSLFLWMDITISNGYQRSVAGAYISEFIKDDALTTTGMADLVGHFSEGHRHYRIFSGIAEWEPLQLILLTFSFLLFGTNKFAFTILPLAITLATLAYLYFLVLLAYPDTKESKHGKSIALLAVVLASLSTFFLYEAATPMLENGLVLFTLASIYHFTLWLRNAEDKQFYLFCLFLGLGFLWKMPVVLVLPSLAVAFFMKEGWRRRLSQAKTYKTFAIGLLIFLVVLSPMLMRDAALASQGLDRTGDRNIGRLPYFLPQDYDQPGWLSASDFEFTYGLPEHKLDLIAHRYELSYLQKAVVTLSSAFFNWVLLPLLALGLLASRKPRRTSFTDVEVMLGVFFIVNVVFYSLYGLIPRYMIPASVVVAVFAARGAFQVKPAYRRPAIGLTLLALLVMSAWFLSKVHDNDHIQSMQHDYGGAAAFMLERSDGEFTVITSRQYQMAFYLLQHDNARRAYVELVPERQDVLSRMLEGDFSPPELLEGTPVTYNVSLPPVRFVVVHERLETGPLPGSTDYNVKEFMDAYSRVERKHEIGSRFPNSRTWIYELRSE